MNTRELSFLSTEVEAILASREDARRQRRSWRPEPPPEICVYRDRTIALLRRFCRISIEIGRLPSLVGREFFRSRVSSYRMHSFEDRVIFAYDVERCLDLLDEFARRVVGCVVLQDYSYDEAARLLGCGRATVARRFAHAIDELSAVLLERKLLKPFGVEAAAEDCQEGKRTICGVSD